MEYNESEIYKTMAKKIYVDRSDTLAGVVDKILGVADKEIILYVPRATKIGTSPNNFRLLKREMDSAGKEIEIESVDDSVLEMSKMIGFKSTNPFFKKNSKQVSDIIHPGGAAIQKRHAAEEDQMEESIVDDPKPAKRKPKVHNYLRRTISRRHKLLTLAILVAIAGGVAFAAIALPEAKILVSMESINRDFKGSLLTGVNIKAAEFTNNTVKIPGLFVEKTKNITRIYPATGTQSVSIKATGTITISNAYSSSQQNLVTGTRFQSPDGKIFRLTKSVTVPGAKTVRGNITASTIKATVQADVAGAEYNIGPAHFTIPGFKGTPKYAGFYGDSDEAMTGGLVGTSKVATDADIAQAKNEIHKTLEDALKTDMILSIPEEIKVIQAATKFTVTKEDINKVADSDGNFKITSVGSIQSIGFKEADIKSVLEPQITNMVKLDIAASDAKAGIVGGDLGLTLKDSVVIYGDPRIDFTNKNMSLPLKFHSTLRRNLDLEAFKQFVSGKPPSELAHNKVPFPGISAVKIRLWPFWVMSVPKNPSRVTIDVQ